MQSIFNFILFSIDIFQIYTITLLLFFSANVIAKLHVCAVITLYATSNYKIYLKGLLLKSPVQFKLAVFESISCCFTERTAKVAAT